VQYWRTEVKVELRLTDSAVKEEVAAAIATVATGPWLGASATTAEELDRSIVAEAVGTGLAVAEASIAAIAVVGTGRIEAAADIALATDRIAITIAFLF
jgi:hypothetical protein